MGRRKREVREVQMGTGEADDWRPVLISTTVACLLVHKLDLGKGNKLTRGAHNRMGERREGEQEVGNRYPRRGAYGLGYAWCVVYKCFILFCLWARNNCCIGKRLRE